MGYFPVRYDSRVVIYERRGLIRLATKESRYFCISEEVLHKRVSHKKPTPEWSSSFHQDDVIVKSLFGLSGQIYDFWSISKSQNVPLHCKKS